MEWRQPERKEKHSTHECFREDDGGVNCPVKMGKKGERRDEAIVSSQQEQRIHFDAHPSIYCSPCPALKVVLIS